jgi:CheY-like chemotaxis protein
MSLENATILLVEDEPNDVFFMQRAFDKARLLNPLKVVTDGEQAIAYLKGDGLYANRTEYPFPFLMLLDLRLPKRSGFEVLQWVRAQPGLRRLLVVVLTSSKEGPDINQAYDLGANSYLVKPPQAEELTEVLHRLNSYWIAMNIPPECENGKC